MNPWRWVDPRVDEVRVEGLRAYLLARGWKPKPHPRPQVLVFEEPGGGGGEPVVQVVPASERLRDYRQGVIDVITSLSAYEDRHPVEVLNDILGGQQGGAGDGEAAREKTLRRGSVQGG
jgi:hypothetical protein